MAVAKITGQGLLAIACSVALLWGCIIGERVMLSSAASRRIRVLREMEQLQRNSPPVPAITPMPSAARPRSTHDRSRDSTTGRAYSHRRMSLKNKSKVSGLLGLLSEWI